MSKAIVLNANYENNGEIVLPASYEEINKHNLYLYVKSYLSALRSNTASAKTRAEVSGGGKKPKAQKGKKMPGQYGNTNVSVKNEVLSFDVETGILVLKGSVSGANGRLGKVKVAK